MKIVCATDFSEQARAAADMAAALASRLEDTLLLVHVVDPAPIGGGEMAAIPSGPSAPCWWAPTSRTSPTRPSRPPTLC
jgi:nucleotide-binding universal stress UspA family protein